jgi:hypothetical protein
MGVETLAARVFSQCSVFRQDCRVVGGDVDFHWAGEMPYSEHLAAVTSRTKIETGKGVTNRYTLRTNPWRGHAVYSITSVQI